MHLFGGIGKNTLKGLYFLIAIKVVNSPANKSLKSFTNMAGFKVCPVRGIVGITPSLLNASEKGATWMTEKGAKKIVLIKPIFRVLDSK